MSKSTPPPDPEHPHLQKGLPGHLRPQPFPPPTSRRHISCPTAFSASTATSRQQPCHTTIPLYCHSNHSGLCGSDTETGRRAVSLSRGLGFGCKTWRSRGGLTPGAGASRSLTHSASMACGGCTCLLRVGSCGFSAACSSPTAGVERREPEAASSLRPGPNLM